MLCLTARFAAVGSAAGALIYGGNDIDIPALDLVADLGVGGVALALQSTVKNLFGGCRSSRIAIPDQRRYRFGPDRGEVEMVEKAEGWPRIRCAGASGASMSQCGPVCSHRTARPFSAYGSFLGVQEKLLLQMFQLMNKMGIELAPPAVAAATTSAP